MDTTTDWITAGASVVAACGIIFAAIQVYLSKKQAETATHSLANAYDNLALMKKALEDDHEWRRIHYTSQLLTDWNASARIHLAHLNKRFPNFQSVPDFISNPDLKNHWRLPLEDAKRIFEGKDEETIETRDHLISLFNFLEGMAVAWEKNVVDQELIRDSCGVVMVDTCTYFAQFILLMTEESRRAPWPPLDRVVEYWEVHELRQRAENEADKWIERSEETSKKLEEKPKLGTVV